MKHVAVAVCNPVAAANRIIFLLRSKETRFGVGVQEQNMLQVQHCESRPEVREGGSSSRGS